MMYVTLYLIAAVVSFIIIRLISKTVLGIGFTQAASPTFVGALAYVLAWPVLFPLLIFLIFDLQKQIVQAKLAEIFKVVGK